jgi:hypothetical protein
MKHFFDHTFRPFFIVTGIGTALGGLAALWPRWTAEKVVLIPYDQDYTLILQHWGFMLGLMGVFMIVAALWTPWRKPILSFSVFEKAFLVYLVLTNVSRPYARGLWFGAGMDATVVVYTVVYFGVCGFRTSSLRSDRVLQQAKKAA